MGNLDLLLPPPPAEGMTMLWGTVTADGTQVLLDGDTVPLPASTPSLVPLKAGARVSVDRFGKGLRVTGALSSTDWVAYTPSFSCQGGVLGSVTSLARYVEFGTTVHVALDISIVDAGTAYGSFFVTLPVPADLSGPIPVGYGREGALTGVMLGTWQQSASSIAVLRYDGTTVIGTGAHAYVHITYEKS